MSTQSTVSPRSSWALADEIATALVEGFGSETARVVKGGTYGRKVIVRWDDADKEILVRRNGQVVLPVGFPAEVYAGIDLDVRSVLVEWDAPAPADVIGRVIEVLDEALAAADPTLARDSFARGELAGVLASTLQRGGLLR